MNPFKGHPAELRRLFIIEMWERFSYFGLASLLVLFMTSGKTEGGLGWSDHKAMVVKGAYGSGIYLLAIPCSLLADRWFGAATAVLLGGVLILAGHVTLALPLGDGFILGLILVAIGTSFLKPSIGGLVGDLYKGSFSQDKKAGMALFYMSISLGGLLGPFVLGYLRTSTFVTPNLGWHVAFGAAAVGMGFALCLFVGFWRTAPRTPVAGRGSASSLVWSFVGAFGLLWLFVWGTDRPALVWALYGLVPVSALYYAMRGDRKKEAVWLVMLIISTLVSVVVGQMVSGMILVIKENVDPTIFGWSFPVEYFAGIFSGFIILFSWVFGKMQGARADTVNYRHSFTVGAVFVAIAIGIIGLALELSGGAKISAWVIIGSYAFKAAAEVLIIPTALALMHDVSAAEEKSLTMAIWYLGAGLGVNMAKMLGLSMGSGPSDQGAFFLWEAAAAGLFALILWMAGRWLAKTVSEIRSAQASA